MNNIIEIGPATLRKPEPLRALPALKRPATAQRLNPLAEKRRAEDPEAMIHMVGELQKEPAYQRRVQKKRRALQQEREAERRLQYEAEIEAKEWAELKANLWAAAAAVIAMGAILWQVLV